MVETRDGEERGTCPIFANTTFSLAFGATNSCFGFSCQAEIQRFRELDADGSGDLSLEEVISGASILGVSETFAAELFKEVDTDGSGSSTFHNSRIKFTRVIVTISFALSHLFSIDGRISSKVPQQECRRAHG